MKKLLPYAPFFSLALGAVSMALRFWMLSDGVDSQGLYPRFHPAWILLCLLCIPSLCLFFLLSHRAERRRTYRDNFPPSVPAACGNAAMALGIAIVSIAQWQSSVILSLYGLLCCALSVYGGLLRLQGKKRPFFIPAALCLFFALRIFSMGRVLGSEPELNRFLFPFLAVLTVLLACYQQWGFDVDLGDRCKSLFWNLTGAYLCLAAIPGNDTWPLYLGVGLWLLTDLCSLRPIRRAPVKETEEDVFLAEQVLLYTEDAPAAADLDTDALIADILRDIGE